MLKMKSASKTFFKDSVFLYIIFFISNSIKNSRTIKFLDNFGEFLLNSEKNSNIVKIYKTLLRNFAKSDNNKTSNNIKLYFYPFLFALLYLLFIALSSYKISFVSVLIVISGILSFAVFFYIFGSSKSEFYSPKESVCRKIALLILVPSIFALLADLYYAGKIPLLDPIARKKLSVLFTYASTFSLLSFFILGGIYARRGEKIKVILLAVISTALISMLGYRTQTIVSLLGFMIIMHYYGIIRIRGAFILAIISILLIVLIGFYRMLVFGAYTPIFSAISDRIALTLSIYDYLVLKLYNAGQLLFGYMHGYIMVSTFSSFLGFIPGPKLGPRTIIAKEFGVEDISMTSTLYGTVVYDYGIVGVVMFSALLGIVAGLCFNAMQKTKNPLFVALFSHIFAYLIVGIETGLVDFNVFLLYFSAFFTCIYFIKTKPYL